jgi:hypothetical protein
MSNSRTLATALRRARDLTRFQGKSYVEQLIKRSLSQSGPLAHFFFPYIIAL